MRVDQPESGLPVNNNTSRPHQIWIVEKRTLKKDAFNSETQKRANCANVFMLMVLGQCIFWAFLGVLKPKVGVSVRCSNGFFSKAKSELVLIFTLFACLHVEVNQFVSR